MSVERNLEKFGVTSVHVDNVQGGEAVHPLSRKMPIALVDRDSTIPGRVTGWELDTW